MSCAPSSGSRSRLSAVAALCCVLGSDASQGALRETLRIGLSAPAGAQHSFLSTGVGVVVPGSSEPGEDAAPSTTAPAATAPAAATSGRGPTRTAASADLLVPLPNDTISAEYWTQVNEAIAQAARLTTPAPSFNDPLPTKPPSDWEKVFQASQVVTVVDSPQRSENLNNWEFATPMPPRAAVTADGKVISGQGQDSQLDRRHVSVVPYDMQIGARIMQSLSEKSPETPPPSQAVVDETFVAQCPILMFADTLAVRAPRCGNPLGEWADPATDRPILRWQPNNKGGLRFGVDSAVSGQGSALFANLQEKLSIDRNEFELFNCLNVKRYTVEESIVKVDHMAANAFTTMVDHDLSGTGQAIFYEYTIKHPNGSAVAKTTLFRLDQDTVNFTRFHDRESPVGDLIAVATRNGHWKRDQWRTCTDNPRGWQLTFTNADKFETAASVMDLRVAAATVINLMAYRDEEVGKDGFQHVGQGQLYWSMLSVFFSLFLSAVACLLVLLGCWIKEYDKKMKRFCFRLEQVLLPKRPINVRTPILNPAY